MIPSSKLKSANNNLTEVIFGHNMQDISQYSEKPLERLSESKVKFPKICSTPNGTYLASVQRI